MPLWVAEPFIESVDDGMPFSHERLPALVTTEWLQSHLDEVDLVVLDGSFELPGAPLSAAGRYANMHIIGAHFFDIEEIADQETSLPHMLPTADVFQSHARAMGISNSTRIVVYDAPGLMSAGRVWWMFRVFGHKQIAILDGGLKKWIAEGRAVTSLPPIPAALGSFNAIFRGELVRSKIDVLKNIEQNFEQVVDARSSARFNAIEKEFRPGLRSGHIPGSRNVPFSFITDSITGEMKSAEEIGAIFNEAGIDLDDPVVTTCGSGVTACALAFALHLVGSKDVAVYDGAWAEWGLVGETPIEPK